MRGWRYDWPATGLAGRLLMIVKSAHVYETERGYLRDVLTRYR